MTTSANIPMKNVGPIKIVMDSTPTEIYVPLATYETPLWPSTNRGARASRQTEGIKTTLVSENMTRSVIAEATDAATAVMIGHSLKKQQAQLASVVQSTSGYAELQSIHIEYVGPLLYIRFAITSGDASGHNMVTKAADALLSSILEKHPALKYISISGNYCTDKKVSAVNGILGRGKSVIAEIIIPRDLCLALLKTTPEKMIDLNIKKNLIGSTLAGSLRSANAHYANVLLALYLATGQDAANIVEGSQGITYAALQGDDLYFSVNLPNIIVGTVGNGKEINFVQDNLKQLGCTEDRTPGANARRLAMITAATVLCSELSLLAAQTNPGELMRSHCLIERKKEK